jgi:hypothetical protein
LETHEVQKFRPQRVWNAVQFQKIDSTENEAPILAALMKVDVTSFETEGLVHRELYSEAMEEKEQQASRMVKLLEAMNKTTGLYIPSGLIFLPLPRLRNDRFRETKQYG